MAINIVLAFLVIQTKQNTEAIHAQLVANRAETRAAIWALVTKSNDYIIDEPGILLSLFTNEGMTDEKELQMNQWLIQFWGSREFVWLQYRDGVVDESTYKTIIDERYMFEYPRMSEWRDKTAHHIYDPDFVEPVNSEYRD